MQLWLFKTWVILSVGQQRRVSAKHLPGLKSEPEKYLTNDEETELEEFLIGCAFVGFARSRTQVLN